jgi:hypothetical protein
MGNACVVAGDGASRLLVGIEFLQFKGGSEAGSGAVALTCPGAPIQP